MRSPDRILIAEILLREHLVDDGDAMRAFDVESER